MKTKAVAFLRAGGQVEDDQYRAISRQYDSLEHYAGKNNIHISHVIDCIGSEDIDFKLAEVLAFCKENPSTKYVLVSTLDRISRKTRGYVYWQKAFSELGAKIVCTRHIANGLLANHFMEYASTKGREG
jgi:DNA invertase Pin-like site-specific DNA recombinase